MGPPMRNCASELKAGTTAVFVATLCTERTFAIPRRIAPELCQKFLALEIRGRREDRVLAAPAVSCAMVVEVRTRAYRAAESIRHSLRNGSTAYNVLSPENGSFASVAP